MNNILFAAAGSGGHLFPALAVAQELESKFQIHFLVTGRDFEDQIPKSYLTHYVKKTALRHQGIWGFFKFFFEFPMMFLKLRNILKHNQIQFVLGLGGYTSGPALLVAKFCSIPTALVEPNACIGLSNKLSAPFVDYIFTNFLSHEVLQKYASKTYNFGLPQFQSQESDIKFQDWDLVIMGGSQGARGINEKMEIILKSDYFKNKCILWQTGAQWLKDHHPLNVSQIIQIAFVKNIKAHLNKTKLVISRTGAGAISDIVDTLCPSILIPLHLLNDPHYIQNARILVNANAALLYQENESMEKLENFIKNLLNSESDQKKMKANLLKFRYKDIPSKKIAQFIEEKLNVS